MSHNDVILIKLNAIFRSKIKKEKRDLISWFPGANPRVNYVLV